MSGGPLTFYYGLWHDLLVLMMFKQPQHFRLAYSPSGAGVGNPAWDYVLHLDDVEAGGTHAWDLCLAVKPYTSRADVLDEVKGYLGTG